MGVPWATVITVVCATITANANETIPVDVCLSDTLTPGRTREHTKAVVSSIFENIQVRINWYEGEGASDCFKISLIKTAPPSVHPKALATTWPTEARIVVYHDRMLRRLSRAHPSAAIVAPAYVIAHELAHAMQGIGRHSNSGILKPEWSDDDFTAMLFNELYFDKFDVVLIRQRLAARTARYARK